MSNKEIVDDINSALNLKLNLEVERRASEWIRIAQGVDFAKLLENTLKERDQLRPVEKVMREALCYAHGPHSCEYADKALAEADRILSGGRDARRASISKE